MTKLSRIPRLLLLPALCLAACTADEPATLNADGQALVIEDLRIAGSGTRTAQPIEGSFVEGSRLQAKITYNGQSSTGQYTYNNNVWTYDAPAPAYWLTGGEQSVTLRTPYPDPIPAMPPDFNATNWHEYDILEYSGQTAPITSFTLSHMRAQLCVTLTAGTGLTDAELAGAEVMIKDSNTQLWHTNGAHYALLDPDTYATLPALTITLGGETYTYTPGTDAPALTAGECLMLALSVSKAQVSALGATSTGWQELTATGTEVAGVTVLYCPTPGSLSTTNNLDNLSGRVYVTGTIDNTDLSALTGKLKNVTHLYIAAESGETGEGGLTVPAEFACQFPYSNTSLQAVAILHATSIGDNAFLACTILTSIDLPKATSIGIFAFQNCTSLTSIDLPAAETIGDNAFDSCDGLESIDLPVATSIGNGAFNRCTNLTSIDLPAAKSIGNGAFSMCSSLKSIDLPAATSIGSHAFEACYSLESIDLPVATSIGDNAFRDCASLKSIDLPVATSIGSNTFEACYSLESIDLPVATSIGDNAFRDCASLTSIDLPKATSIGSYAFSVCDGLESIELPAATSIGSYAFSMCDGLTSIDLPAAETIGESAFWYCTNLKSIDLPVATSIGNYAFEDCTSLTSIDLPAATSIGSYAFSMCDGLRSIALPLATSIGNYAFEECSNLKSIDLPAATSIGNGAFNMCTSLTSIDLPAAETIGDNAFEDCSSLESIAVPSSTTTIGNSVFFGSSPTTLFLTDESTTADDAAGLATWGGVTWQTIYYGYQGSGDYLDPGSYEGQWTMDN